MKNNLIHSARLTVAALAASAVAVTMASPVEAAKPRGTTSLATVLAADSGFDRNAADYDILEAAVLAVLENDPESPVGILTQGRKRLVAFAPNDFAFERLAKAALGEDPGSEEETFGALAGALGVDAIETVLLYHVVPGQALGSTRVLASDGARLTTAQGQKVRLEVTRKGKVFVLDRADGKNARVVQVDINRGNRQVAHGINRVLMPAMPH